MKKSKNEKIKSISEKTLIVGIDIGSETHYARAFDWRGYEYSKKAFEFSNSEEVFISFMRWIEEILKNDIGLEYIEIKKYLSFDLQGSTLKDDRIDIVYNGVFKMPLTDKKISNEYDCQCSAAASGTYDCVPKVERKLLLIKV